MTDAEVVRARLDEAAECHRRVSHAGLVDIHVNVPGVTPAQVQEVHRTVLHAMCELIEHSHV